MWFFFISSVSRLGQSTFSFGFKCASLKQFSVGQWNIFFREFYHLCCLSFGLC